MGLLSRHLRTAVTRAAERAQAGHTVLVDRYEAASEDDAVADHIEAIESAGWRLDQAVTPAAGASPGSTLYLVFRSTDARLPVAAC